MPLTDENKRQFQEALLAWFREAQRAFPWRVTSDPYAILVAEKLLQQTVARHTVITAYEKILGDYPTPEHLCQADIAILEDIVHPLGFKYRAMELRGMACELVARHGGEIPRDLTKLLALPGVGDYTARAVMSFAFGDDVPVVDTNVARFLYRIYGLPGALPANPARKKQLLDLAQNLVPTGKSRDFNLAVLDLCAEICKPTNPRCVECPVQLYCVYGSSQVEHLER